MTTNALYGYTVYSNPSDFPGRFVVRRWRVLPSSELQIDREPWAVTPSLDEARASIPRERYRIDRHPSDDPVIVEVWI